VSFIVELEESRTVWVVLFQVEIVHLRLIGSVTAFFTYVHLCSSLFVLILMGHSVYFETMRLQRAPLSERLLTQRTFIRADTCVRASVSFQIERIVEAFAAEGTKVAFDVRVTFHVPVEKPLQREALGAEPAREPVVVL